jgi:hypothetical protein
METVDHVSFFPSLVMLLLIFFHKFITNSNIKNLIIIIFLIWLSNSLILSFVSVTVPLSISLFVFIILNKNYSLIKYFFIFNILFIIILNFPIIGRIPKIFINVIFFRQETSIYINDFFYLIKNFFIYTIKYFYLYFFIIFYISIKQISLIKDIGNKNIDSKIYFLTFILMFFLFVYTILASSSMNFFMEPIKLRGIGMQNVYASSAFIFFIFLCNQNILPIKNYKIILIFSLTIFIVVNYNYIKSRNEKIIELKTKENILKSEIINVSLEETNQ